MSSSVLSSHKVEDEMKGSGPSATLGRPSVSVDDQPSCDVEAKFKSLNPTYYHDAGFFGKTFFIWLRFWVENVQQSYFEAKLLHPLPDNDKIELWQPRFSKYISDGLLRLEKAEHETFVSNGENKITRPYYCIVLRALFLTFGTRVGLMIAGTVILNILKAGMSVFLKNVLRMISDEKHDLYVIVICVFGIVFAELFVSILEQHITFYNCRLEAIMEATISITLFQHGVCNRRAYASAIGDSTALSSCKGVVHKWPCNNGDCGTDPLRCPARRYQNKELPHSIYTHLLLDTYTMMAIVESMIIATKFLTTLICSLIVIKYTLDTDVLPAVYIVFSVVSVTIFFEVANGCVYKHSMKTKDRRYAHTADIVGNMKVIKEMGIEDKCYNVIDDSRCDELSVLFTRVFLSAFNGCNMNVISPVLFLVILLGYIRDLKKNINNASFEVGAPIALLYIVNNITKATEDLPKAVKAFMEAISSTRRLERFVKKCSPNYYMNKTEERIDVTADDNVTKHINKEIPDDTMVEYKSANFTWAHTRDEILNTEEDKTPMFTGLDFELKRGDFKIITGSQGCGKTSFIKSILGEMSLVSGSMAVAPLSTGMPIFYTSQEIWLPADNIRSIITFGYAYNEEVYNEVVRCAELVTDFSAWEDGDLRVISDKGYSLSGGQRVRISLARALYAYMIFSKANETMENNRCCFLMCLDEPFNGLDVSVATAIFNNLFNKDTGLLVREDIAVVMAMSKMSMDICFKYHSNNMLCDLVLHHINDGCISDGEHLKKYYINVLHEETKSHGGIRHSPHAYSSLNMFSNEVMGNIVKGSAVSKSANRCKETLSVDAASAIIKDTAIRTSGNTRNSYYTFFSAIGYPVWLFILAILLCSIIVNQINAVYIAEWSDSVKSAVASAVRTVEDNRYIIEKHERVAYYVTIFVIVYITLTYFGTISSVIAGLISSNRLYVFAANSLFFRSSGELHVKKALGDIMTMLSADLYFIDEVIAKSCLTSISCFLNLMIQIITICYTSPLVTPVPIVMCLYLYIKVARAHILSSNRLQCFMFEAMGEINAAYEDAMEGSPIYRSYRREKQSVEHIYEITEVFIKTRFLKKTFPSWIVIVSKAFTAFMIICVSMIPLIRAHITGDRMYVAKIGLGITLTLGLNSIFSSLIYNVSLLERMMCSMARFDHYFVQGKFHLKEKFDSMNESILSIFASQEERDKVDKKRVGDLVKRRKVEFRNFMFRRYRSLLSTLFYKPKIDVLDISAYLPADHTTLSLDNVCVPQPNQKAQGGGRYILSDVSAKAFAGDVIGIVGRTGAGKSTLLSVLQNISRRREGSVLLDGRELNDIPRSILRHIIGVLPQIPFVLKGWTLRRFLDPGMLYTDEEIYNALECCGLLELVKSLPDEKGLDAVLTPEDVTVESTLYLLTPLIPLKKGYRGNVVGSYGTDDGSHAHIPETCFSMGQLRLLSFARLVLYRENYRIILIDEPPSNNIVSNEQDNESNDVTNKESDDGSLPIYSLVKIYFKHCTTFIVAHDKKALKTCGSIWVLHDGRMIRTITGADGVSGYLTSQSSSPS